MSSENEIYNWLRLSNTANVGAVTFERLLKFYGSAEVAVTDWQPPKGQIKSLDWAKAEFERANRLGIAILLKKDDEYPQALRNVKDAPPILYVKGNRQLLQSPAVAIVGSRNAGINACKLTEQIAFELTEQKILVVSGMARGIDSAAHRGAISANGQQGPTIAVLGTGADVIYPSENTQLYNQIAEQGLIISEMPLGCVANSSSFPRRNRIISGISQAVLVAEAAENSGSLITARYAVEQQRLLFAIPGSPMDGRSAGTNRLLRNGALFAENARDIIDRLGSPKDFPNQNAILTDCGDLFTKSLDKKTKTTDIPSGTQKPIEAFLSTDATDIDEIIRTSGFDSASVAMQLLDLEIEGRIIRLPGNKIALNRSK